MADKAQATWRAFTIQGPQVALAMLRGSKRIESRKRRMAAGWYYLHVGRQSINSLPPECSAALRQTWPDAPEEASLSKSCVVGMVCLGKVIQASKVENPWVCASLPLVHEIVATVEFRSPVRWEKGKQAVWHVKDGEMQGKLKEATASGERRSWDSLWPTAEDERPAAKRQKLTQPWKSKKRKRRSDAGNTRSPAQVSFTASKRRRLLLRSPLQKPKLAKAPASEALQASTSPQRGPDRCSLAQRVAAGRTLELLTTLMAVHFLKICDAKVTQLQPRGGLFAFRDDQPVFILSVWTSRKIPLADVVPLKQATFQGQTVLKAKYTETRTCRRSELKDVGLHFQVANCANDRRGASGLASMIFCNMLPSFKERPRPGKRLFLCSLACLGLLFQKQPGETQGDQGRALRENAALAARWQAGNAELGLATSCTVDHSVRSVVPVRLQAHLAERAASGITHHAAPRADESRSFWILDLPLPVQVDGRRHRCHTCAHLRIFDNFTVEDT